MEITIEKEEFYKMIKIAVKEALEEELLERFLKNILKEIKKWAYARLLF